VTGIVSKATGTTDMASGLRMAITEVTRHLDEEGVNRVVLVGDGVPNDDRQILPLVAQAAAQGISVTALGLGNDYDYDYDYDYDETLMGHIAQLSSGRFFYVDDSAKVASFFSEEVTRLHEVVARHAVLDVRPGPGVTVTGVVGGSFSGSIGASPSRSAISASASRPRWWWSSLHRPRRTARMSRCWRQSSVTRTAWTAPSTRSTCSSARSRRASAMADEPMLSPEAMREKHDRAMRNFQSY
jgi:hypothetical protein